MTQIAHKLVDSSSNHVAHSIVVATINSLTSLSVSTADIGRIALVSDTKELHALVAISPNVWKLLTSVVPDTPSLATQSVAGLMSTTDKTKLDGLSTPSLATQSVAGLMASTDKTKLDGLSTPSLATQLTSGLLSNSDKVKLDDLVAGGSAKLITNRLSRNRILVNNGGVLECEGAPIREMGICAVTLLTEFQESGTQKFLTEFPLIAQSGMRFIRVRATSLFSPGWQLGYFANKTLFYTRTTQFLDAAKENGLGIVLSMFSRAATLTDVCGEHVEAGFATTGSATRTLAATVINEFTARYANHPAVAAWEIGNEYSLFAANSSTPSINVAEGTPASYDPVLDVMSLATMRSFYSFTQTEFKKLDTTNRIIMTGNGGPAGQIEKSLANYLTLIALDNPVDTWSFHKYARNDFGNRAYSTLADMLITINKQAKIAGKPLILGEFGQERNETYGGYGGLPNFQTACQAIYKSGIQLAFAWEWSRTDSTTAPFDFMFHPNNTINSTDKVYNVLKYFNDLMRSEGYVSTTSLVASTPTTRVGKAVFGTATTAQAPSSIALNSGFGFSISFWVKKTRDDISNRKLIYKYGVNSGWFIGYGTSPGTSIYAQVQWSDGTSVSTNLQTSPQYTTDGWVHYTFQLDQVTSSPTAGLTVYQNGVWVKTNVTTKTYNPSSSNLTFFSETAGTSTAYVGLKEVRMHSRALTDNEARNLYLYGVSPQSIVIGDWDFNNDMQDATVNANHLTLSAGTVTYADF